MIHCPQCSGVKFESHHAGHLYWAIADIVVSGPTSPYYTCVECDYVIANPSDLSMKTVTVYVLGNSLSKQRQGLHSINKDLKDPHLSNINATADILHENGYFSHQHDQELMWIFTKVAWEKYQAEPQFPLAEGQHATEVKKLY